MKHQPVFFDIETTGFDPLDNPSWKDGPPNRVTCIAMGWFSKDWWEYDEFSEDFVWTGVYIDEDEYELIDSVLGHGSYMDETADRITEENDTEDSAFLVTWNGRRFDHPYLSARASRYRIDDYPIQHSLRRLDMMRPCARDYGNRSFVSEDDYLAYLGIENDDEFTGSDMKEAFVDRRWGDIKSHAESDVKQMMEVFFKKKDMMYEHFYDHYNIDVDYVDAEEVEF